MSETTYESVVREALEAGARGDWLAVNFQHVLSAFDELVKERDAAEKEAEDNADLYQDLGQQISATVEENERLKRELDERNSSSDLDWAIKVRKRLVADAHEAGAAWMREKAAKVAEDRRGDDAGGWAHNWEVIADAIRALPTREET